jgi:hypothetical protein
MSELSDVAEALIDAIDRADANHNRPRTGMQVPFHGDFASAVPSVMRSLRWWADRMRVAIDDDKAGGVK